MSLDIDVAISRALVVQLKAEVLTMRASNVHFFSYRERIAYGSSGFLGHNGIDYQSTMVKDRAQLLKST